MNAIEIRNVTKRFGEKNVISDLNMTVPLHSIYGFIGENGSGKSTTEKMICGLLNQNSGSIKIFDKDNKEKDARIKVGCLIEAPGCFANYSVWNNLMLEAINLSLKNPKEKVREVLKIVRMEGSASNKFKNCSLGMKQRIGIAMALLGNPALLILDEPINGLDADGVRIMREVLIDITNNYDCTVLISSHILGELEKIATHYGIIRNGKMIEEISAEELNKKCRTYVGIKVKDKEDTLHILKRKYHVVKEENDYIKVYDKTTAEEVVKYLCDNDIYVIEVETKKVNLEEYYIDIMNDRRLNNE